jgi:transcriptional regulator with XRE-family HTH domain
MRRRIRSTQLSREVGRRAAAITSTLARDVRSSRRARHLTQASLGDRVGRSQSEISEIERGRGGRIPLETWIAIGIALDRPLAVTLSRPLQPADTDDRAAGHLRIQEHILKLARGTGRAGTFELPTRPLDPSRSADVGLRDAAHATRILVECWNTIGDMGAAVRATQRKVAQAAATWPGDRVASVWVVAATPANRALLARYPHVLEATFPGSSRAWVHALEHATTTPPSDPGLVWCDPASSRLTEHRRATIRA